MLHDVSSTCNCHLLRASHNPSVAVDVNTSRRFCLAGMNFGTVPDVMTAAGDSPIVTLTLHCDEDGGDGVVKKSAEHKYNDILSN